MIRIRKTTEKRAITEKDGFKGPGDIQWISHNSKTVFGANSDLTDDYSALWRKHDE